MQQDYRETAYEFFVYPDHMPVMWDAGRAQGRSDTCPQEAVAECVGQTGVCRKSPRNRAFRIIIRVCVAWYQEAVTECIG
jgi:hypothetical protein